MNLHLFAYLQIQMSEKLSYLPLLEKPALINKLSLICYQLHKPIHKILEHGISVNKYFNDLTNDMKLD
jgi:hypothetical protein